MKWRNQEDIEESFGIPKPTTSPETPVEKILEELGTWIYFNQHSQNRESLFARVDDKLVIFVGDSSTYFILSDDEGISRFVEGHLRCAVSVLDLTL
ncbi:hypothetical protein DFA_09948 [Cavenderia fasciculata]|uniref:Uncharacterized protein n=1 Tax=Cavenderia fasciculata TaxID=261658 RepID=F4Q8V5_CACFS|nr:uncharacterized protein DFA_09948 [Cavenderia fasciculata]EGG15124.1 hypothetical protein DFA_09948 [Cavenderia fasciculata]|eukprot:XP_004351844.1 hypothetical protein DFA_09948 [Cavenderia fasciculata]